jgi:hypothetical protein
MLPLTPIERRTAPFSTSFTTRSTMSSTVTEPGNAPGGRIIGARAPKPSKPQPTHRGWRAVGWFGGLLALIGFADMAVLLFRPAIGNPEWQFGTMAMLLAALPLPTIGVAAVVGALLVNRARTSSIVAAAAVLALGVLIAAVYLYFLATVPLALQAAEGPQGTAIYRTIFKATIMGVGFGSAYLVAGIVLLRNLPQRSV